MLRYEFAKSKQNEAHKEFQAAAKPLDTKVPEASTGQTKETSASSPLKAQLGEPLEPAIEETGLEASRQTYEDESAGLARANKKLAATNKHLPALRTIDNALALMEAAPLFKTGCFDVDLFSPWCKPAVTSAVTLLNNTALAQQIKSSEIVEWAAEHKTESWWSVWFIGHVSLMYAGAPPWHMTKYIAQYAGVKTLHPQEGREGFSSCMPLAIFNGGVMLWSTWQFTPIVAVPATLMQIESTALTCMAKDNIQSTSHGYTPLIADAAAASVMGVMMLLKWSLVVSHPLSCGLLALSTLVSVDVTAKLLPPYFNNQSETLLDADKTTISQTTIKDEQSKSTSQQHQPASVQDTTKSIFAAKLLDENGCVKILPGYLACDSSDHKVTWFREDKPAAPEEQSCHLTVSECCKQGGLKICPFSHLNTPILVGEAATELPDCHFSHFCIRVSDPFP